VQRLSEHDASALLALVSELRDLDDPLPFPPRFLAGLQDLIAADEVAYNELDLIARNMLVGVERNSDGEEEVILGPEEVPESDLWWQLRPTHPSCGYRMRTGDWTTARKVSDFATLREFRRTPIYDAFYRGVLDHWLDVGLAPEASRTRLFIFTRFERDDFDERDRLVAALLQPHLARRREEAEAALHAAESLASIEEGASDEAQRVVLCSATGVIEFASAWSRAVLERYLGLDNGRIPAALLQRRELRVEGGERVLSVRIARTDNLHLLMLEERDTRIERLSSRERQVLVQVAAGKTNEAIALDLDIAPRTVAKHLEHTYRKLGVQNRTAAAGLLSSVQGR
jgi:DNA-binding NarL/FixJ family response regulator